MALPSYSWPQSGAAARGTGIAAFRSGVAVADWTVSVLWPYAAGAFGSGIVLASGAPGFSGVVSDGASGVWTVSYAGTLWHQPSSGAVTSRALATGAVYVGCAMASGTVFVLAASGAVLSSGGTAVGVFPTYARALAGSGVTLAALLPASGLGTMTTAGVTGLIAFPAGLITPSCLAMVSGTPVAVGGWQPAASLAAANAAALSPVDATVMAAVASGSVLLWRTGAAGALGDAWTQTQALTGVVNLDAVSWSPDGFHVMGSSVTSGVVQILGYATGALSLTQSLAVSGACATAWGNDSLHALVAQSGQAQLATLIFTSTWAAGTPVTGFAGITSVTAWGASGAVAAYSSGLAWLNFASGIWSVINRVALGFTPALLTVDPFLNTYAAASGQFSVIDPSGVNLGSGAFSGVPTGLAVQQGRVVLSVPAANALYLYGQGAPGSWSQQASGVSSLGARAALALSDTTLFVMGSGSTVTMGFSGQPFVLTSVVSGAVAQRAAGAWTVTALGVGHTPSAVAYDVSGNLRVVTTQNTAWVIAASGTVLSSGIVPQIPQQAQTVPLGVSAMMISPSGMYCATSIPGLLIEIA